MILARANYKLDIDGKVIQAGKFDNRSTEEDREAFLRSLLEDKAVEENDPEEDDWENEELNEILQRAESDLTVFQRIDEEREDADARAWKQLGNSGKAERLITDKELPDIYLNDNPVIDDQDNPFNYGRGQRSRDDIMYDDGLTEEQWTRVNLPLLLLLLLLLNVFPLFIYLILIIIVLYTGSRRRQCRS
jgi:ATP-dependent helicase STH1/SNF2